MVGLCGAIAFPITPFDRNGDVDLAGVRVNAEMLASSGVCSIVAPSGTGELFSLTQAEIATIVTATVQAVAGRKPVIASVGMGPRVGAELAAAAEASGADAVLVLPPYYQQPDPDGLLAYYLAIARATSLPIIPYARDSAQFSPELVVRLAREAPNFVAFKDGRGDVRTFMRIREHAIGQLGAERLLWLAGTGDDLLAPYVAAGAQGFTSSIACFWPEVACRLWECAVSDTDAYAELYARAVQPFYAMRARRRGYEVAVMKAAMDALGYAAGPPRAPLVEVTPAERGEIAALVAALEIPSLSARLAVA